MQKYQVNATDHKPDTASRVCSNFWRGKQHVSQIMPNVLNTSNNTGIICDVLVLLALVQLARI